MSGKDDRLENLRRGRKACGVWQAEAERRTTCVKREEMVLRSVPRPDEAKARTGESKWRASAEHGTEAIEQREADAGAIETERAQEGPCRACSSVA